MTHLIIAKNISEIYCDQILNLPQFYLGCVAPDAVHNRPGYISDYKKQSHLITGHEKWGMTTNNDEWKNNVAKLINDYLKSDHFDYVLGYCTHVLSDIYVNINVWTPIRLKYNIDLNIGNGYDNNYHHECNKIDIELALSYEHRDIFWINLAKSKSIDLPDIIFAAETEMQKEYILNQWYKNKEHQDLSLNKIKTYEDELSLIERATVFIRSFFNENLT